MAAMGWQRLIPPEKNSFRGDGHYPIDAYSEFVPPPRVGWKPYATQPVNPQLFARDDPFGWYVSEWEEALELQPGLVQIAKQVLNKMERLLDGDPKTGLPRVDLKNNPFWPPELAEERKLPQEKRVILLPIALSRTQDDKGRVRWTLFGNSEQGPGKAFWKSFYSAPQQELPAEQGVGFFCKLLNAVYGTSIDGADELRAAGFRILADEEPLFEYWREPALPSWTAPWVLGSRAPARGIKYLLTFRPFGKLPPSIRKAYLEGSLCLLPFPGSLVFWGTPVYQRLSNELPLALQIPLLLNITRHRSLGCIQVPQSGFLHEPNAAEPSAQSHAAQVRNHFKRTHRWDRILRDEDELDMIDVADPMLHVLFSTSPDDIKLYNKPMARNAQLWTKEGRLLLDGPNATPENIQQAKKDMEKGGLFGYRFVFPAMRVGTREVYWHRPLVAYRNDKQEATVLPAAPLGYLTAYDAGQPNVAEPIELWPRLHQRDIPLKALELHRAGHGRRTLPVLGNVRKWFDAYYLNGSQPLPQSFARQLVTLHRGETLEDGLARISSLELRKDIAPLIEPEKTILPRRRGANVPDSITYKKTANRAYEVKYWKMIAALSEGKLLNKNNADCVRDEATQRVLPYDQRQLDNLADYLLAYYSEKIAALGMNEQALVGEIPFRWETNFHYSWMGGWLKNQEGAGLERDLLIMIPGRDRTRAVIMSDHYDTAYMSDKYEKDEGGCGARMAACGADDNHSATAAMMLAAPIFLELSRKGKLRYDIWLIHLTGEEFPADSLGARHLTQKLVERSLRIHLPNGKTKDLSKIEIQGLYVSDMIAHNNDRERDIFQIAPGTDPAAQWLAMQAHFANEIWNESVPEWNKAPERAGRKRGRRSPHGEAIPEIAPFLALNGQVRPTSDPRSTLYNTDGQIFSDAGVPCVLFMENYDIQRRGYHDTHDTMENIDLEYGAALSAITIETVARAATIERK